MSAAADRILEAGLALPVDERRRVAEALLESVPDEPAENFEEEWNREALRRIEQLKRGEVEALDGETALRELEVGLAQIHRR